MENSIKITLIIAATIIGLALLGMIFYQQVNPRDNISVQGQSTIRATPDIVTAYFNVQTRGDSATDARDKNSKITDDMITSLIKIGFERKDIITENFNVYPEYDWNNGNQRLKGYITNHNIKVKMPASDTSKIGDVIDAGVDSGALISYIAFELSDELQSQYKALALEKATIDARTKAEAIASGAGKKVGDIVSVSESSFNYYPWRAYENSAMDVAEAGTLAKSASTNIQPGEQEIIGNVMVTFSLK
ncbi:SIMPL domain-containing protein [Candidatus Pacearchaeota archaeon]|nr:SIMPL domain-containing protein [Candidatus Pacearchaeota archaeon]